MVNHHIFSLTGGGGVEPRYVRAGLVVLLSAASAGALTLTPVLAPLPLVAPTTPPVATTSLSAATTVSGSAPPPLSCSVERAARTDPSVMHRPAVTATATPVDDEYGFSNARLRYRVTFHLANATTRFRAQPPARFTVTNTSGLAHRSGQYVWTGTTTTPALTVVGNASDGGYRWLFARAPFVTYQWAANGTTHATTTDVTLFALPPTASSAAYTSRTPHAPRQRDIVANSMEPVGTPGGVWTHELVHAHQTFDLGPRMRWVREGSAQYYAVLIPSRTNQSLPAVAGGGPADTATGRIYDAVAARDGTVLSQPSTWANQTPYDEFRREVVRHSTPRVGVWLDRHVTATHPYNVTGVTAVLAPSRNSADVA